MIYSFMELAATFVVWASFIPGGFSAPARDSGKNTLRRALARNGKGLSLGQADDDNRLKGVRGNSVMALAAHSMDSDGNICHYDGYEVGCSGSCNEIANDWFYQSIDGFCDGLSGGIYNGNKDDIDTPIFPISYGGYPQYADWNIENILRKSCCLGPHTCDEICVDGDKSERCYVELECPSFKYNCYVNNHKSCFKPCGCKAKQRATCIEFADFMFAETIHESCAAPWNPDNSIYNGYSGVFTMDLTEEAVQAGDVLVEKCCGVDVSDTCAVDCGADPEISCLGDIDCPSIYEDCVLDEEDGYCHAKCECNPCHAKDCNTGTCEEGVCKCAVGFEGESCEIINPCAGLECNSGICKEGVCDCFVGFEGPSCDIVNPCADVECNSGTCEEGVCECAIGSEGENCEIVNPCAGVQCNSGMTCKEGVCGCEVGFEGERCDIVNPCASVECNSGMLCEEGVCVCEVGFEGESCEIVNPCAGVVCDSGTCLEGTCVCEDGFEGERCDIVAPNPCDGIDCNSGTCANGVCQCDDGFEGDNCTPVDPCKDVECNSGMCIVGKCKCDDGFEGDNCTPVDPCEVIDCNSGTCKNGKCLCKDGYGGNRCQDLMKMKCSKRTAGQRGYKCEDREIITDRSCYLESREGSYAKCNSSYCCSKDTTPKDSRVVSCSASKGEGYASKCVANNREVNERMKCCTKEDGCPSNLKKCSALNGGCC